MIEDHASKIYVKCSLHKPLNVMYFLPNDHVRAHVYTDFTLGKPA